jgi:hypothetical protein
MIHDTEKEEQSEMSSLCALFTFLRLWEDGS